MSTEEETQQPQSQPQSRVEAARAHADAAAEKLLTGGATPPSWLEMLRGDVIANSYGGNPHKVAADIALYLSAIEEKKLHALEDISNSLAGIANQLENIDNALRSR